MNNKKILISSDAFLPRLGGGPVYTNNIVNNLSNYDFEILTKGIPDQKNLEVIRKNLTVRRFTNNFFSNSSLLSRNKYYNFSERLYKEIQFFRSQIKYIRNSSFDVFHFMGMPMNPKMHILFERLKIDFHSYFADFRFIKKPKVISFLNLPHDFSKDIIHTKFYNHYIKQFDNIICIDNYIYHYCEEYINRKNLNKKLYFIPVSVDTKNFTIKQKNSKDKFKIGFAGRLARTTDLERVNFLIAHLPSKIEFHLAVTGDLSKLKIPPDKKNIKLLIDTPHSNMSEFYKNMDVLFNPLLYQGVSFVTLEAMSCGCPVIMYNNADRYLPNSSDGFVVEQDKEKILKLIIKLSTDVDNMSQVSSEAAKKIREKYSHKILISKIEKVYKSII